MLPRQLSASFELQPFVHERVPLGNPLSYASHSTPQGSSRWSSDPVLMVDADGSREVVRNVL